MFERCRLINLPQIFGSFYFLAGIFGPGPSFFLISFQHVLPVESSFDPFMDSNLFSIKWEGPLNINEEEIKILGDRHLVLSTDKDEKYECILPESKKTSKDSLNEYSGPTAEELLSPLFKQTQCSYRIESYWTYELCHGKHLKQYHESREPGSQPKVQEYFLGFGNHRRETKKDETTGDTTEKTEEEEILPVKELDGEELPYFEVIMTDGSKCDLINTPRKAHVFYICHEDGRGEVYELKESSTCEYEVLVLTATLCKHPKYRPKKPSVKEVRCHAVLGSPLKPSELTNVERETKSLSRTGQDFVIHEAQSQPDLNVVDSSGGVQGEDSQPKRRVPVQKMVRKPQDKALPSKPLTNAKAPPPEGKIGALTDKQTLRDFFKGHSCLTGGTGWWRYEVCFGKYVRQFHVERAKETATIFLGHWYQDKHMEWIGENPLRRPKHPSVRKSVSLFYTNGDRCDLNNKPRNCEVRLKCFATSKNPHAVMLSLIEPKPCEYILTVESALFCPVLKDANDDGMFDNLDL